LGLPREVLLERRDAALELFDAHRARAAARDDAFLQELPGLDAFAERVVEQDASALLRQERGEVPEQLGHAAPRDVALERAFGADREEHGVLHELGELRLDVRERFGLLAVVPDIALRDDEDDLVARLPEELVVQEDALALFERLPRVEQ